MQRKTTISYIYIEDLQAYLEAAEKVKTVDANGKEFFFVKDVDDKLEINLWTPNKVWLYQELQEQKAKFDGMQKPSDAELKELGKETSQYYELQSRIERLEKELEKYK